MKLSNIKTKSEFYEVADIWYQRAIRLTDILNSGHESVERRLKAASLWCVMLVRMKKISQLAIEISKPLPAEKCNNAIIGEGIEFIMIDGEKISLPKCKYKINTNPNLKP